MMYDVIILGQGPAGISASIYLARSGLSTLVIGKDSGALERAEYIENYYGFPEPITGAELVARGIVQAKRFGVEFVSEEAVFLGMEDAFVVRTSAFVAVDGGAALVPSEYRSRSVLIATGKQRTGLNVPGFEAFRGKGISFCATCDGFFYRGKRLGLVGSGDYAASEFAELLHFTKDITVFSNGIPAVSGRFPSDISVVTGKIASFEGTVSASSAVPSKLERIVTINSTGGALSHPVDGVFIAIGTAGASDFAAKLGVEVNGSEVVVDRDFMTNIPGIFAAGDCIGGFLQVAKAVSDGALAAKGMIAFLKKK